MTTDKARRPILNGGEPPALPRRIRTSADVRNLLDWLSFALASPEHVERCIEKSDAESLRGFSHWLRSRRCKICRRPIPLLEIRACGSKCRRVMRRGAKERERHRRQQSWFLFNRSVQRPMKMPDVAERLGIPVDEARQRAETDFRRGRLVVYRGFDGQIREVGKPIVKEYA